MSPRKTALDRAIERVDQEIAEHEEQIKALRLARAHLVDEQPIRKASET